MPPIDHEFGLCQSRYDTRTAAPLCKPNKVSLYIFTNFLILLRHSGGTICQLHFIVLLKTKLMSKEVLYT